MQLQHCSNYITQFEALVHVAYNTGICNLTSWAYSKLIIGLYMLSMLAYGITT